jgi:NADH:ubiquinone oxidoreductase subunit F (NADH-binding)
MTADAVLAASAPGPRAGASLPRLIPAGTSRDPGLADHLARLGPPAYRDRAGALIPEIEAAGLTGRGGAAFPVHRKLSAVATGRGQHGPGQHGSGQHSTGQHSTGQHSTGQQSSGQQGPGRQSPGRQSPGRHGERRPVVVANGAEGEPASFKDRSLLWLAPHLVLDGLQLAVEAVGAGRACLYVPRDDALTRQLAGALAQRSAAGLDRAPVELITAPDRFLAGEESALVSRINGAPARPRFKQPPVFERGVGGLPTLVQNVETLAHLALIARYGARWFRGVGTPAEPGSMLCTVHRADGGSYVIETEIGAPLGSVLGWPPDSPASQGEAQPAGIQPDGAQAVQAVLCGGYHGAWLAAGDAAGLALSEASLRPAGAFAGAGVLAELPAGRCGLAETARVARYLALESAGQCGPCFNGLPRIAAALTDLAGPRPARQSLSDVRRWAGLVEGRGACHHPDGFVRFVRSALAVFRAEIGQHAAGRCTATEHRPFLPVPEAAATEADWS